MDRINRTRKNIQKFFSKKPMPTAGRPRKDPEGRLASEVVTHTTIRIDRSILDRMKLIAANEKMSFRDVMEVFCRKGIEMYEAKHGRIENLPKNGHSDII